MLPITIFNTILLDGAMETPPGDGSEWCPCMMGFGFAGGFMGLIWMLLWLVIIVAVIYAIIVFVRNLSQPSQARPSERAEDLEYELRRLRRELEEMRRQLEEKEKK